MKIPDYENKMRPRAGARALLYMGEGASVDFAPKRDLTLEEVATHGGFTKLLATGLYITPEEFASQEKGK